MAGSCASACERDEGAEYATRSFYHKAYLPGHVIQEVYRFSSDAAAKAKFQRYREVEFQVRQAPDKQFVPPPELIYHNTSADDYYVGCGIDKVPACRAIMRYGYYFIWFYFDIDSQQREGLRIEDLDPILRACELQIRKQLNLPNTP